MWLSISSAAVHGGTSSAGLYGGKTARLSIETTRFSWQHADQAPELNYRLYYVRNW